MDILPAFYEQLRKLRESGIKMKDLAEELDLTSSVLSSLYTSVLPTYMGQISAGKSRQTTGVRSSKKSKKKLSSIFPMSTSTAASTSPTAARPSATD